MSLWRSSSSCRQGLTTLQRIRCNERTLAPPTAQQQQLLALIRTEALFQSSDPHSLSMPLSSTSTAPMSLPQFTAPCLMPIMPTVATSTIESLCRPRRRSFHYCTTATDTWRTATTKLSERCFIILSKLQGRTTNHRGSSGRTPGIMLSRRSFTTQKDKSSTSGEGPPPQPPSSSSSVSKQEGKGTPTPAQSSPSSTTNTSQSRFRTEAVKAQQAVRQGVHKVEERLQQVLHDVAAVSTGDQLAVASIVLLLAGLLAAPYVISQMKASDRNFDGMADTDDPVDDFTQLVLGGWDDNSGESKDRVSALEKMLSDLVQSKALQQAAQKFVLQIVQAPEVKDALQRLLMSLWKDLVEDPETIRQVIHLLAVAIQDPAVKEAAIKLVLDVVAEDQVQTALVAAVQKLGDDPEVQKALQMLLANTTHQTLNDAEILDHSMEFATDVLGDDVVQQTAGEALRNTIKNAFRPAASVGLTATGVGFLLFGLLALGYARSSEYEARLLDTAARSLQVNAAFGLQRLITWPARALGCVWNWMRHACVNATDSLGTALGNLSAAMGSWVARAGSQTGVSLWTALGHIVRASTGVAHSLWGRTSGLVTWLVHATVQHVQKTWKGINLALLEWSWSVVGWGRQWISRLPAWWPKASRTVWLGMQSVWQRIMEHLTALL